MAGIPEEKVVLPSWAESHAAEAKEERRHAPSTSGGWSHENGRDQWNLHHRRIPEEDRQGRSRLALADRSDCRDRLPGNLQIVGTDRARPSFVEAGRAEGVLRQSEDAQGRGGEQ